ncbi:hypothetical protein RUND412_006344 [Rhizina undulata]
MANEYFTTVRVDDICITDYLNTLPPGPIDYNTYQKAIDNYVKTLNNFLKNDTLPDSTREHVASLLELYRMGPDKEAARRWLEGKVSPPIPAPTTNITFNGNILSSSVKIVSKQVEGTTKRKASVGEEGVEEGEGTGAKKMKSGSNESTDPGPLKYNTVFGLMTNETKWKLRSNTYVEDILQKAPGQLAKSFVIDVHDATVQNLFDDADWKEILEQIPPWPDMDKNLVTAMDRFWNAESTAELRQILNSTSYLQENEQYSHEKHCDLEWIELSFRMLLPLYENPNQDLIKEHSEQWFAISIWSVLVDRCLQNLAGVTLRRGETTSIESTTRRNRGRVDTTQRKRIGARFDGIAQDNNRQIEYLAIEISNSFNGENNNKWIHDIKKVAKSLHGMLYRLQNWVKQDKKILGDLHMAGLVCAGLHCQVLRLAPAKGHTCILSRDELLHVPTSFEPKRICLLLLSIWRMKMISRNCKTSIRKYGQGTTLSDLLKPPSIPGPQKSCPTIPPSCDTDEEKKSQNG